MFLVQLFNTALTRPIRQEQPSYSAFRASALHLGPIVKLTFLTELPESFSRWVSLCLTLVIISDIKTSSPHCLGITTILSFNDVHIYFILDAQKSWVPNVRYNFIESVNINWKSVVFYWRIKKQDKFKDWSKENIQPTTSHNHSNNSSKLSSSNNEENMYNVL